MSAYHPAGNVSKYTATDIISDLPSELSLVCAAAYPVLSALCVALKDNIFKNDEENSNSTLVHGNYTEQYFNAKAMHCQRAIIIHIHVHHWSTLSDRLSRQIPCSHPVTVLIVGYMHSQSDTVHVCCVIHSKTFQNFTM